MLTHTIGAFNKWRTKTPGDTFIKKNGSYPSFAPSVNGSEWAKNWFESTDVKGKSLKVKLNLLKQARTEHITAMNEKIDKKSSISSGHVTRNLRHIEANMVCAYGLLYNELDSNGKLSQGDNKEMMNTALTETKKKFRDETIIAHQKGIKLGAYKRDFNQTLYNQLLNNTKEHTIEDLQRLIPADATGDLAALADNKDATRKEILKHIDDLDMSQLTSFDLPYNRQAHMTYYKHKDHKLGPDVLKVTQKSPGNFNIQLNRSDMIDPGYMGGLAVREASLGMFHSLKSQGKTELTISATTRQLAMELYAAALQAGFGEEQITLNKKYQSSTSFRASMGRTLGVGGWTGWTGGLKKSRIKEAEKQGLRTPIILKKSEKKAIQASIDKALMQEYDDAYEHMKDPKFEETIEKTPENELTSSQLLAKELSETKQKRLETEQGVGLASTKEEQQRKGQDESVTISQTPQSRG